MCDRKRPNVKNPNIEFTKGKPSITSFVIHIHLHPSIHVYEKVERANGDIGHYQEKAHLSEDHKSSVIITTIH